MPKCWNSFFCFGSPSRSGSRTLWQPTTSSSPTKPASWNDTFEPSCSTNSKKEKENSSDSEERDLLLNLIAALAWSSSSSSAVVTSSLAEEKEETKDETNDTESVTSESTVSWEDYEEEEEEEEEEEDSESFCSDEEEEEEEEQDKALPSMTKPYMTVVKPRTYYRFGYQDLRKYYPSSHIQRRHLYPIYEILNEDECDDDSDLYPPCVPDPRIVTWSLRARTLQDRQPRAAFNGSGLGLKHHVDRNLYAAEPGRDRCNYEFSSKASAHSYYPSKNPHGSSAVPYDYKEQTKSTKQQIVNHTNIFDYDLDHGQQKNQVPTTTAAAHMLYPSCQTPYIHVQQPEVVIGDGFVVKHDYCAPALSPACAY